MKSRVRRGRRPTTPVKADLHRALVWTVALRGEQLLVNPGFEQGDWGWKGTHEGRHSIATNVVHSGARAYQIRIGPRWAQQMYQDIPAAGGQILEGSAWVKTERIGERREGARVAILWLNRPGKDLDIGSVEALEREQFLIRMDELGTVGGTQDWTRLAGRFTAPHGTRSARFWISVRPTRGAEGAAWFDDLELRREK